MDQKLLTTKEVADLLRLNERTIRDWVKAKKIPHRRLGNRILYPEDEIQRFIDAHPGVRFEDETDQAETPAPVESDQGSD